jgi:hypothetical protein
MSVDPTPLRVKQFVSLDSRFSAISNLFVILVPRPIRLVTIAGAIRVIAKLGLDGINHTEHNVGFPKDEISCAQHLIYRCRNSGERES